MHFSSIFIGKHREALGKPFETQLLSRTDHVGPFGGAQPKDSSSSITQQPMEDDLCDLLIFQSHLSTTVSLVLAHRLYSALYAAR